MRFCTNISSVHLTTYNSLCNVKHSRCFQIRTKSDAVLVLLLSLDFGLRISLSQFLCLNFRSVYSGVYFIAKLKTVSLSSSEEYLVQRTFVRMPQHRHLSILSITYNTV